MTNTIGVKLPSTLVRQRPGSVRALRAVAGWRGVVSAHGCAMAIDTAKAPAGSALAGGVAGIGIEQPNPGFPVTPRSMREDRGLHPWRHRP